MATTKSSHEGREIRKKLALRFNLLYNCHEVYTSIHGSHVFRWMKITDDVAKWYKESFGLSVSTYLQPSAMTGGILEIPVDPRAKDSTL